MERTYQVSYDSSADVLMMVCKDSTVKESIEISEDIILDIDKQRNIVSLELLEAYTFLHTLNKKISKKQLKSIETAQLKFQQYRNYWFITLVFTVGGLSFEEKLPAFSNELYQSPLIANA